MAADACVACGSDRKPTRHHVVPKCYLRHMPAHPFDDAVDFALLCRGCHDAYEVAAEELKRCLGARVGVPLDVGDRLLDRDAHKLVMAARALARHVDRLPAARRKELAGRLAAAAEAAAARTADGPVWAYLARHRAEFARGAGRRHLASLGRLSPHRPPPGGLAHGPAVVLAVGPGELVRTWRRHFRDWLAGR
jgi:hypothetical protein